MLLVIKGIRSIGPQHKNIWKRQSIQKGQSIYGHVGASEANNKNAHKFAWFMVI